MYLVIGREGDHRHSTRKTMNWGGADSMLSEHGGRAGRVESSAKGAEWHEQAQELLDAYCCTTHPNFMKRGQTVPYILPHLPAAWPGRRRDDYFEPYRKALGALFEAAGDNETARAFRE